MMRMWLTTVISLQRDQLLAFAEQHELLCSVCLCIPDVTAITSAPEMQIPRTNDQPAAETRVIVEAQHARPLRPCLASAAEC